MGSVSPLLSFLLMIAAGWVHRHQLTVIEFLQAENRYLKEKLGDKRLRFTDAERALLARKAKRSGVRRCWNSTLSSPQTHCWAGTVGWLRESGILCTAVVPVDRES